MSARDLTLALVICGLLGGCRSAVTGQVSLPTEVPVAQDARMIGLDGATLQTGGSIGAKSVGGKVAGAGGKGATDAAATAAGSPVVTDPPAPVVGGAAEPAPSAAPSAAPSCDGPEAQRPADCPAQAVSVADEKKQQGAE